MRTGSELPVSARASSPRLAASSVPGAIPEFLIGGLALWTVGLPGVPGAGRGWEGVGVRGQCRELLSVPPGDEAPTVAAGLCRSFGRGVG